MTTLTTFTDAVDYISDRIRDERPTTEVEAIEVARDELRDVIDNALIYHSNTLELWDGSTDENIILSDYDDIMSAITASTYFQLSEQWSDAVYDGIDAVIDAAALVAGGDEGPQWARDWASTGDRDAALWAVYGEDEN